MFQLDWGLVFVSATCMFFAFSRARCCWGWLTNQAGVAELHELLGPSPPNIHLPRSFLHLLFLFSLFSLSMYETTLW